MNFKFARVVSSIALAALAGCSADADPSGSTTQDVGTIHDPPVFSVKVEGAWQTKANAKTPNRYFRGIVFKSDQTFFADAETGIKCITTPCPTSVRLTGVYAVIGNKLLLTGNEGQSDYGMLDQPYVVSRSGDSLSISTGAQEDASNELELQSSYCAEAADCAAQGLLHPMCAPGGWTCSAQNTCGFSCGAVPVSNPVWPADRTELVAQNHGGGFAPPAPAGSACGIGQSKYTLDIPAKKLSWEVCKTVDFATPFTLVTGSRVLTSAEMAKVDAAMNEVTLSKGEICGADKPFMDVAVTSTSKGKQTYTDSFYSCLEGEKTFVDNIDTIFTALRDLAE